MLRTLRLPVAVAAALTLGAGTASADSISYIKDGNIWITTPDGARQHQVTRSGGYVFASQADDGTLLGQFGQRLHRLDRSGRVLADFSTPVSEVPPGAAFTSLGPIDPQISPDGTKVAYGYHFNYVRFDPYCGYPGGCRDGKVLIGTGYSHADRTTAWDEPGLGRHSGWSYPAWIDNSRVLMSDVAETLNDQVWTDVVGDGQNGQPWFQGHLQATTRDAELNRQGDLVATVESRGRRDDTVRVYQLREPIPATPWLCLTISGDVAYGAARGYSNPSFSPDGRSLAVDTGTGIAVVRGIDTAGCTGAQGSGMLIPGGQNPDWGPADVPAAPSAAPGPGPAPAKAPAPVTAPAPAKAGGRTVLSVGRVRLGRALRRGIAVRVRGAKPGAVKLVARRGRRIVARGAGVAGANGTAVVRLRFTPSARRDLRAARRVVLRLSGAGATSTTTLAR